MLRDWQRHMIVAVAFWLGVAAAAATLTSASAPAVSQSWSYEDWKPGGQRTTIDGITFDSTIHCGNGHDFVKLGKDHYRFRARIDHAPYAWRFCFKMECPQAVGRTITLEVADFNHAGRTPFHESATAWSTNGEDWFSLSVESMTIVPWTPTGEAAVDEKYGDASHVPYGVQYRLKLAGETIWLASPTPYTLKRRDQLLERLLKTHPHSVRVTTIGHSRHSRTHGYPLRMARITAPGEASKRKTVFVIAGEHCSETAGIYACEGWMEEVLAHPDWLEDFVFCFVPIVNVDGAYYGATYYNMSASLADGIGENISPNWPQRTLPEVKAIWPLLVQTRPVFFASIHNGRHRRTMEIFAPAGSASEALLAAWRREVGFEIEGVRSHGASTRAWGVLRRAGITERACIIETLLLCRQKGFDSFQQSYIQTGRQLARGTIAALRELKSQSKTPKSGDLKRDGILRIAGDDFTAQLPWFYHGLPLDEPKDHDIYSFEVNGLPLPPGDYSVTLVPKRPVGELAVGFDGRTFRSLPVRKGRAELRKVGIRNRMLSLYVKAEVGRKQSPLEHVLVHPPAVSAEKAELLATRFNRYRRKIASAEREILQKDKWNEFHTLLNRKGFGKKQLREMFDAILGWCERRQVLDPGDIHYGAVYSEEDKYDFRDAAAAAVCFTYAWRASGKRQYRRRALAARDYVYKGQHIADPANKAQYGGFCHMIHGKWGPGMQRLGGPLTNVSGVETCINVNLLVKTFELGLKPSPKDIKRLSAAAGWVANSEFAPGVFRHHEGATHDCQNSNALGAEALTRAYHALEQYGEQPPAAWLEAARRGLAHFIEGQEAIGCWPYVFATIGRGQAFREHSIPDQGMGTYHFLVACRSPPFRELPGAQDAMKRAARWWLSMSRIDRGGPMPTIDLDDRLARGTLKFSKFTWCRFMAAACLMRIAENTEEKEPWRQLAMRYMEHVYTKRWNISDPDKAPVCRASPGEMTLCSWIQAAEWAAVLLGEMEERLP